jgi:hypothetical protein
MLDRMVAKIRVQLHQSENVEEFDHDEAHFAKEVISNDRHTKITAEELARKWIIGIESARATLKSTTQHGVRHAIRPLSRRYRTDILQSRLRATIELYDVYRYSVWICEVFARLHLWTDIHRRSFCLL